MAGQRQGNLLKNACRIVIERYDVVTLAIWSSREGSSHGSLGIRTMMTVSTHAMLMVIGIQINCTWQVVNSDLDRGLENWPMVRILPVCVFLPYKRDADESRFRGSFLLNKWSHTDMKPSMWMKCDMNKMNVSSNRQFKASITGKPFLTYS
jgi:hypothetical protein